MIYLSEIDDWIVRPSSKIRPGDVVYPLSPRSAKSQIATVVEVTRSHIELNDEGQGRYYTKDTLWAVKPGGAPSPVEQ